MTADLSPHTAGILAEAAAALAQARWWRAPAR